MRMICTEWVERLKAEGWVLQRVCAHTVGFRSRPNAVCESHEWAGADHHGVVFGG